MTAKRFHQAVLVRGYVLNAAKITDRDAAQDVTAAVRHDQRSIRRMLGDIGNHDDAEDNAETASDDHQCTTER